MGLLTDRQIQSASHRSTDYFLSDGEGLYLRVRATRKMWMLRYKQDGREVRLGLGRYPFVSLAVARVCRSLAH
ncbi:Arm DNA-binding domain-containing protein [Paraburkholderia sp. SIMBA_030]|uniref:Arm DNA-binding domain-containing protein n=1 Tax=Paraburkholderia sp. SIMBA_030 TaxID=3085773 RepID=UPI003978527D